MDMKFEFVVENMTREQADKLGFVILLMVESMDLLVGGNVHGTKQAKWVKCIDNSFAESLLIRGETYQVLNEDEDYYFVLTMVNHVGGMDKARFIEVEHDND